MDLEPRLFISVANRRRKFKYYLVSPPKHLDFGYI